MTDDWRTPETQALIEALLRLEDADEAGRFLRDLCTLGELRDLAQRWAVVRLLDSGMHYAEISQRDRREHRDDHADRLVAAPRRGRLPADARARPRAGDRLMRERLRLGGPEQGPAGRPDAVAAPRRRPGVRGARPQPRVARPEPPARHPVRAHGRRHRVRRRRRGGPGHHRRRPAGRDGRGAAGRPRARVRPLPAGRRGAVRLPVPVDRRARRSAASRRPTPTSPGATSRARGSPSTSSRCRVRSRSPRGWASRRGSSTSCRPGRRWR